MVDQNKQQPDHDSRRRFLKYSGAAIGGAVVGGVIGGALTRQNGKNVADNAPVPSQTAPVPDFNQATMFFTQSQLRITEAAVERIFPKDDIGPGAVELGVAFFIDHQMASTWGRNGREYRMGPFNKAEPTQGDYQSIERHEMFTMGLQALQTASMSKYSKSFFDIADEEKDAILTSMQNGEIMVVNGITGKTFFNLLRILTIEGVYSDPLYGGNKNMLGWKMRKYPGNQMAYTDIMEKNEFVVMDPKSLRDHFGTH